MPKKVLIVDDSSTVVMAAKMILRDYNVVIARDGEQGLHAALVARPDLILLDVVMPKLDGFQVCRRIRATQGWDKLPVLMLTTRGEPEHVEEGYAAGCTDYITKPFDGVDLLTKVRDILGE